MLAGCMRPAKCLFKTSDLGNSIRILLMQYTAQDDTCGTVSIGDPAFVSTLRRSVASPSHKDIALCNTLSVKLLLDKFTFHNKH